MIKCRGCGGTKIEEVVSVIADIKSINVTCTECNTICFSKPYLENDAYIMPFGAKKGSTIQTIVRTDRQYAIWAAKNIRGLIGKRFAEELAEGHKEKSKNIESNDGFDHGEAPF